TFLLRTWLPTFPFSDTPPKFSFYRSPVVAKKSIGTVEGKLNVIRAAQVNGAEENAACKIEY
ncbi:MAG TPA: hypothetical protein H9741_04280, partial [Candidatus Borkfalkia faecipullorum]|nr:hypothetical protein [Candidatus Borkfalkia faecipullorum]